MILGIIGGGRAAWAFGSTWRRLGWPIAGVALRDGSTSPIASLLATRQLSLDELAKESELILIAVNDAAIADFATMIPETKAVIFHPSGSMTSVTDSLCRPAMRFSRANTRTCSRCMSG